MKPYMEYLSSPVNSLLNAGGFKISLKTPFYFQVERTINNQVQSFLIFNCPTPTPEDPQCSELMFYYPLFNIFLTKKQFVSLALSQFIVDGCQSFSSFFNQECYDLKPTTISKILQLYLNLKIIDRTILPSWVDQNCRLSLSLPILNNPFFSTTFFDGFNKSEYLAIALRDNNGTLVNSIFFNPINFYSRSLVPSFWKLNNQIVDFEICHIVFNPFLLFSIYQNAPLENSQALCFSNPNNKLLKIFPFLNKEKLFVISLNKSLDQLLACLNFLSAISNHCFSGYKFQFNHCTDSSTINFFLPQNDLDTFMMQLILDINQDLSNDENTLLPKEFLQIKMDPFNHFNNSFSFSFLNAPSLIVAFLNKLQLMNFFPENFQIQFID